MRVLEILLSKNTELSSEHKIDMLRNRMNSYVDKILSSNTSPAGKEFLKSRLRDDYYELKDLLKPLHKIDTVAEDDNKNQYEVYDRHTGKTVGGPYKSKSRARSRVDKLDNEYGAYRYGVRPYNSKDNKDSTIISEAVHRLPLSDNDFELVIELFKKPIPAILARIYVNDLIDDDELNDQIQYICDNEPGQDVRPIISQWIERVMPDQLWRFGQEKGDEFQKRGVLSPIHGYDPQSNKSGFTAPISGGAYGRF